MKIFVFDIDNTIIIHTNIMNDFYHKMTDSRLSNLISDIGPDMIYIYTNGIYSHGKMVIKNLKLEEKVNGIFSRDTIPYMKPLINSFIYVNNSIIRDSGSSDNEIIFFDDLIENLLTANRIGWKTVWISPNYINKNDFIDYAFPNIYEAMIYFKLKEG